MLRTGLRPLTGLIRCRWLRWGLWTAGLPLLGLACSPPLDIASPSSRTELLAPLRQTSCQDSVSGVVHADHVVPGPNLPPVNAVSGQTLPIDLDTVMHLAEEQNAQVAQAREKLHESMLEGQAGLAGWLPKITAGLAYYRHEGGIQNPDGTFVHSSTGAFYPGVDLQGEIDPRHAIYQRVTAERKHWQDKAELSKVTSEVLLEAATTYIDLLTARRGEAIGLELEAYAQRMLKRAEDLKASDPSATVLYEAAQIDVTGRKQARVKLHQQGDAAAAKLAYLLGLPCEVRMVPMEPGPVPIDVVDVTPPTCVLVEQALTHGPGVQELQGLLAVIQSGMAQLEGPINLVPTLQMSLFEGPFGAGPGANMTWDNRFDAGLQARWNVTDWLTARQKQCLAHSKLMQVQLARQDLSGKLAAGVEEARAAILAGREQLHLGEQQLRHASEAYRLSDLRVKENAPGATISEVLQAIRGLDQSYLSYLSALSAHNKAQIRLLLFLGPSGKCKPPVVRELPGPVPVADPQLHPVHP